jgi:Zn-dependent protease with chaperone function
MEARAASQQMSSSMMTRIVTLPKMTLVTAVFRQVDSVFGIEEPRFGWHSGHWIIIYRMNHSPWIRAVALSLAAWFGSLPLLEARVEPTRGFNVFSQDEEVQLGKQNAADVMKQMPVLPDSDPVVQYVQKLGARLTAHAPGYQWPYNFHVVNVKEINAFALPGGPIFVNLGTIQAADNEAQLAGVMSHEISHVVQRHGTRAASKQMGAQLPLAILGGLMGNSTLSKAAQLGISFGIGSYFLKNSRQSESEADLLGTDIMYDSGYEPRQMAVFFGKLEKEMGAGANSTISQFLSDHPNPGNRMEAVSNEVKTLMPRTYLADSSDFKDVKARAATMKPLTSAEVAAMQKPGGAVTPGTDITPSANLKVFSHNEYQISYPDNWQVFGDPSSNVTIAPTSGVSENAVAYGVMIANFQPEEKGASLDTATHELLASLRQSNPDTKQIGQDETIRVNGVSGKSVDLVGSSPIKDPSGKAIEERDWVVTMPRRDGTVLFLVFISPDKDFGSMRPAFETMLRTLQLK